MQIDLVLTGILLLAGGVAAVYLFPAVGIAALLSIPLIKGYLRENFPMLVGYTYDLGAAAVALFACWANYRKSRAAAAPHRGWGKSVLLCYYVLLLLALATLPLSRADESAVKKLLMFGIFTQIVVLTALWYVRTLRNLNTLWMVVVALAAFSAVLIFLLPTNPLLEEILLPSEGVLGANRLAPSDFLAMASIWLWVHFLEHRRRRLLFLAMPVLLLGIVALGSRAPFFVAIVVILMATVARYGTRFRKQLQAAGVGLFLVSVGWFLFSESDWVQVGSHRYAALLAVRDSRLDIWQTSIDGWSERPLAVKLVGGGVSDSAYSLAGNTYDFKYPHNWLLEVFVELGPIGLAALGYLFFRVLQAAALTGMRRGRFEALGDQDRTSLVTCAWVGVYCVLNTMKTGSYGGGYTYWFFIAVCIHAFSRFAPTLSERPAARPARRAGGARR